MTFYKKIHKTTNFQQQNNTTKINCSAFSLQAMSIFNTCYIQMTFLQYQVCNNFLLCKQFWSTKGDIAFCKYHT